jgi:hypothetical protein
MGQVTGDRGQVRATGADFALYKTKFPRRARTCHLLPVTCPLYGVCSEKKRSLFSKRLFLLFVFCGY